MVGKQLKFAEYLKEYLKKNKFSNRKYSVILDEPHSNIGYWIKNNSMTFEKLVELSYKDVGLFNLTIEFLNDIKKELEQKQQIEITEKLQTLEEPEIPYGNTHLTKDEIILQLQNQIIQLNQLLINTQK